MGGQEFWNKSLDLYIGGEGATEIGTTFES